MPSPLLVPTADRERRGELVAAAGAMVPFASATFRELRAARATVGRTRLVDAMRFVEPTWVEGVAVVQAVCAQIEPGETPPAVGDIVLSDSGAVSFPLGGMSGADVAIQAVGRLLTGFLHAGGCPLLIWDATEWAECAPMSFGSVRGFGAALTCFPRLRGAEQLMAFLRQSRDLARSHPRGLSRGAPGDSEQRAFFW
ncbi:MAG: hypothetical protein ABI880_01095 [Acidobacteriota bacterium]